MNQENIRFLREDYVISKDIISLSKTGTFATQNRYYCTIKEPVLQRKRGSFTTR